MRTFCYLRVSGKKQSTDNQKTSITQFCRLRGIKSPVWIQDVMTGRAKGDAKRDGWQRIMTEASEGDHVLCWKMDRTGRSAISSIRNILALLEKKVSVTITSTGMSFSATDAMSVFLIQLFSALAELESNHISERVKMSIEHRRSIGQHVGAAPKIKQRSKIQKWIDNGVPVVTIAERLGKSRQAVYSMMQRMAVR